MASAPPALVARPHHGNLPIPWITHIREDGSPDFRVHDQQRRWQAARERLCQLCGDPLGELAVFVGREVSAARGLFGEPPMHPECFAYAREVCPWLGGRPHSDRDGDDVTTFIKRASDPRWLRVWVCREWAPLSDGRYWAAAPVEPAEWLRRPD